MTLDPPGPHPHRTAKELDRFVEAAIGPRLVGTLSNRVEVAGRRGAGRGTGRLDPAVDGERDERRADGRMDGAYEKHADIHFGGVSGGIRRVARWGRRRAIPPFLIFRQGPLRLHRPLSAW